MTEVVQPFQAAEKKINKKTPTDGIVPANETTEEEDGADIEGEIPEAESKDQGGEESEGFNAETGQNGSGNEANGQHDDQGAQNQEAPPSVPAKHVIDPNDIDQIKPWTAARLDTMLHQRTFSHLQAETQADLYSCLRLSFCG